MHTHAWAHARTHACNTHTHARTTRTHAHTHVREKHTHMHTLTSSLAVIQLRSFTNWAFCSSAVSARALVSSFSALILSRFSSRLANAFCASCSCSFLYKHNTRNPVHVCTSSFTLATHTDNSHSYYYAVRIIFSCTCMTNLRFFLAFPPPIDI